MTILAISNQKYKQYQTWTDFGKRQELARRKSKNVVKAKTKEEFFRLCEQDKVELGLVD